jgi:hypothetical protein
MLPVQFGLCISVNLNQFNVYQYGRELILVEMRTSTAKHLYWYTFELVLLMKVV